MKKIKQQHAVTRVLTEEHAVQVRSLFRYYCFPAKPTKSNSPQNDLVLMYILQYQSRLTFAVHWLAQSEAPPS